MVTDHRLLIIALGIALGMYFFHRTGYSPGGIITPGFLALELDSPERIAVAVLVGGAVALFLSLAVRVTGVYGRQRTGLALLFALIFRLVLEGVSVPLSSLWVGWVIPGLLGADMQRQGAVPTVTACLSTTFAAAMVARLLVSGGLFS